MILTPQGAQFAGLIFVVVAFYQLVWRGWTRLKGKPITKSVTIALVIGLLVTTLWSVAEFPSVLNIYLLIFAAALLAFTFVARRIEG